MDLQQEYFQRHAITTPLVIYPDAHNNFSLVLKNTRPLDKAARSRFFMITISYHKQETHPSYYKFMIQQPMHDSYGHIPTAIRTSWETKVYYDEWEDFVLEWAEHNRGELVPITGQELALALWEVFQYSHDHWLATTLSDRLLDLLYVAVDEAAEADVRLEAAKEVEDFVRGKNKNALAALGHLHGLGPDAKTWLGELL